MNCKKIGKVAIFVSLAIILLGSMALGINIKMETKNDLMNNDCKQCVVQKANNIELFCLMYHNVVSEQSKESDYEVKWNTIENDFRTLKKLGYKCVNSKEIKQVVKNQQFGKYVIITFDDGFYGVYKYIPKLLDKYNMKCVVSVVGEFMDMADKTNIKTRCSYMNTNEVEKISKNPRVEIAHHTYFYHHFKKGQKGIKIKVGEVPRNYKSRFSIDTMQLEKKLAKIGIKTDMYCYPYGEYCKESEECLKEKNYKITMTCNEKINILNNEKDLYLLNRFNRSGKYADLTNLLEKVA